jgi:hypothetical protein
MSNLKSTLVCAAAAAGLALSAAAFASISSDYHDAMTTARTNYQSDAAKCKDMTGVDHSNCMRDARTTERAAMHDARKTRHDALAMNRKPHEAQPHNEGDEPKKLQQ